MKAIHKVLFSLTAALLFLLLAGCDKADCDKEESDGAVSMPEASTPSGDSWGDRYIDAKCKMSPDSCALPDDVTK